MLIYKVSPPRTSRLFAPTTYYRTADFKSSSRRPKLDHLQDRLLYAGDREEIAIHLFPDIDRLRVRLNNATRPALTKLGFATDADKLIVIFVNAADQARLPGFVATVYSFDAADFERTPTNEFIARKPVQAIGVEQLSMPEILRDWKIQVIAVPHVAETDALLRQNGIECSWQTPRNQSLEFRPLTSAEEPAGYQVICDTVVWLREKRIKLWEKPLPREAYAARQQRGENFGLFVNGELAAVVSLVRGVPEYWNEIVARASSPSNSMPETKKNGLEARATPIWLCTLATAAGFRGNGWGRCCVERALQHCVAMGDSVVYLDCKPGWLEAFYWQLQFERVAQKSVVAPTGQVEAVLMRRKLC